MERLTKHKILLRIKRLPGGDFWAFGIKQAWAALFGGLLLAAIILTEVITLPGLARYDWLFLIAIGIQVFMLVARLEKPHEVITIVLFHLVGLGMELFKTSSSVGSWSYPGEAFFMLGNVPLFSGFMYAAVGSYIARSWRIMDLSFSNYPSRVFTVLLAVAIYVNFFTHHYIVDFRLLLFAAVAFLYGRVWVSYTFNVHRHHMPLLLAFGLIAFFIWLAENVATYANIWLYPSQVDAWHIVDIQKMGSWFLLMIISFIMVDVLYAVRRKLGL
jgi:uncharacterized membrane protein YoaT (DUF817 family)